MNETSCGEVLRELEEWIKVQMVWVDIYENRFVAKSNCHEQ